MTCDKRLGQAVSADERALEQAVSRVPAWQGCGVSYAPLIGGLSNQNWLVAIDGDPQRYFVKVPGAGTEMFIDRGAANEAARTAHSIGIGPAVVFFDPADGLEISAFLDGYRACTNADFAERAIQGEVLNIYRRLHASPLLGLTKTVFDMIDEHIDQGRRLGALFPPAMPWITARYAQAKAAFTAAGLDLVPCFNDPMPGNFLVARDGADRPMKLIDYEYASNNERTYELGVLFTEMFFDEAQTLELIEGYFGAVRPDLFARVMINRALADLKWATWAIVNRRVKDWDFDYQKYGVWKYMRARDVMYDSRWEAWLRLL